MKSPTWHITTATLAMLFMIVAFSLTSPASGVASEPEADDVSATQDYFSGRCWQQNRSCQNGSYMYWGSAPPSEKDQCWFGERMAVCIKYYGDYVYVQDRDRDGRSAIAEIRHHWGMHAGHHNIAIRDCRNPYGVNTWAKCNFNWPEAHDYDLQFKLHDFQTDDWEIEGTYRVFSD